MTVRTIREFGDPVLREVCRPVTRFDDGLARLVTDLTDTCRRPGRAAWPRRRSGWTCGCSATTWMAPRVT